MTGLPQIAASFVQTRWRCRAGRSRAGFEAWQARAVNHWLAHDLPKVGFYADAPPDLSALPIIDKSTVMADFAAFNQGGITTDEGWAAYDGTGAIGEISIGASTGTSGNRALYAITPAERFRWLGTILAKALPSFPFRAERVAVILPQSSALYETAAQTRRLQLKFFDLREGMETWQAQLDAFDPTCIVGPPRILRALAEEATRLAPRVIYAGAETLDPMDREVIEARFGLRLGQIYMATEGLFGVSCAHGRVHLAEDAVKFEFEEAENGLVNPLVTCFQRQFQIMARYRMNDLLRLSDAPCPCGSPLRTVDEIVGRMDDVFEFHTGAQVIRFTPDVLRNAVLNADRGINDFRIRRTGRARVELTLPEGTCATRLSGAETALRDAMTARLPGVEVAARTETLVFDRSQKLRRVENLWTEGAA